MKKHAKGHVTTRESCPIPPKELVGHSFLHTLVPNNTKISGERINFVVPLHAFTVRCSQVKYSVN